MSIVKEGASSAAVLGEDFPIICEKCLGPNPYCRMIKADMSKECRISGTPFTGFRWQGALKRWKETIICAAVAQEKNCCQSCLADLQYGVLFHVRDHVMQALGEDQQPSSDVSKEFFWANKKQKQLDEQNNAGGFDTYEKLQTGIDKLRDLAAIDSGPVVWQRRGGPLTPEEQERLRQRRLLERKPPADQSVTSLFVAGIPPVIDKKELLALFLPYGDVRDIHMDTGRLQAVVTYRERAAAEAACGALHGNLTVRRTRLRVMWARKKGHGGADDSKAAGAVHDYYGAGNGGRHGSGGSSSSSAPPAPPPGGAHRAQHIKASTSAPPGIRLPPGVKRKADDVVAAAAYPSMNPGIHGARPEA